MLRVRGAPKILAIAAVWWGNLLPVYCFSESLLHRSLRAGSGSSLTILKAPSTCSPVAPQLARFKVAKRTLTQRWTSIHMTLMERTESQKATKVPEEVNNWWKQGFSTADAEDQYLMEPSMGSVPKDIEGTFFKNGPAKFEIGEDKIKHPFDGDGMVVAVSFSAEGVYFRNRFVKTKGYLKELEAGKQLYRGFTNLPGGFLRNAFRIQRKNAANVSATMWAGNLLALWEGGLPHRLDPKSLETFGESKLGESIDEDRPTFSPHTKVDVDRKRLVGFGQHMLQDVVVYEYDANFRLLFSRLLRNIKGFCHDFAVTNNYYIFLDSPSKISPLPWLLGLKNLDSVFEWEGDKRGAVAHIVPRDSRKDRMTIPVPAGFIFHFGNAFEDPETGEVVFDVAEWERFVVGFDGDADPSVPLWESFDWGKGPLYQLVRYRLDVASEKGQLVERRSLCKAQIDFPIVNPRVSGKEHRYIFAQAGAFGDNVSCPLQGIVKVDTRDGTADTWLPEPYEFSGEPTFIPRKDAPEDAPEDFGYIASLIMNGRDRTSELVILDAQNISKGPVCRLPCKGFIPHLLHGQFVPDAVYTPGQIEKSFALTDLFSRKGWNEAKSEFSGLGLNAVMD